MASNILILGAGQLGSCYLQGLTVSQIPLKRLVHAQSATPRHHWASMAHSLEVWVPLVDLDLTRLVARLVRAGQCPSKQDMAAAPQVKLPAGVLNRRKTGFSVPVSGWLVSQPVRPVAATSRGLRGWAVQLHRQLGSVAA